MSKYGGKSGIRPKDEGGRGSDCTHSGPCAGTNRADSTCIRNEGFRLNNNMTSDGAHHSDYGRVAALCLTNQPSSTTQKYHYSMSRSTLWCFLPLPVACHVSKYPQVTRINPSRCDHHFCSRHGACLLRARHLNFFQKRPCFSQPVSSPPPRLSPHAKTRGIPDIPVANDGAVSECSE